MNASGIQTEYLLTLRKALGYYPAASWSTDEGGFDQWTTGEIIEGARFPPVFDLDQPVLLIDRAIYPVVPRKQEDVLPWLTLIQEITHVSNLDHFLARSYQMWVDLSGICWDPHDLREKLTLEQRAIDVLVQEQIESTATGESFDVVVAHSDLMLFVLVSGLAQAWTACTAIQQFDAEMGAITSTGVKIVCEAADVDATRQWKERSAGPPGEQMRLSLDYIRPATRDDRPFWPIA